MSRQAEAEQLDPTSAKAAGNRARKAYGQQTRQAEENQWIVDFLPLVNHIVSKVTATLNPRVDREDLVSAGTVGLVRAARAYDDSKHAEFKTYAYIRIRGAVIDELRRQSFASPNVFRTLRKIREAHQHFISTYHREPGDEELAERAGVSIDKYYRVVEEARRQHFLSIHGLSEEKPALTNLIPSDSAASPDRQAERSEMVRRLARAIQELPERDRKMVLLYYEQDLTMREVAEVLEVTESRVSQMHASALFKLSMKLRSDEP